MTVSRKPRTPSGLALAGKRLWSDISGEYELRGDELRVLEMACRTADDLAKVDAAIITAPVVTTGSMGQDVVNPLFATALAHRRQLAALVKQLNLPDEDGVRIPSDLSDKRRRGHKDALAEVRQIAAVEAAATGRG